MPTPAEAAMLKHRLEIVVRDERASFYSVTCVLENDETVAARTAFRKPLY